MNLAPWGMGSTVSSAIASSLGSSASIVKSIECPAVKKKNASSTGAVITGGRLGSTTMVTDMEEDNPPSSVALNVRG